MNRRRDSLITVLVVAAIAVFFAWTWLGGDETSTATAGSTSPEVVIDAANPDIDRTGDEVPLDGAIAADDLPAEAWDTLALIDSDGPYPYSQDGSTFQNREGRLPPQDRGYYQEFTVETPGSRDRGARRIVAGAGGDLWYTGDHYDSFLEIVGW